MVRGAGTALNVATVLLGSGLGLTLRGRLPERSGRVVTDGLGLTTLMVAALQAEKVLDPALLHAVGGSANVLVVLGALALGGLLGSTLRLEERLEAAGATLRTRLLGGLRPSGALGRLRPSGALRRLRPSAALRRRRPSRPHLRCPAPATTSAGVGALALDAEVAARDRFVEGFVAASLLFCVGPLTFVGSLQDGLGHGTDLLVLKSTLDGFAALAFAASYGPGVAAAALTVLVVQGGLTLLGLALGGLLPLAQVAALTAVGGLLLVGVALRLLRVAQVAVVDLLPALVVAPLLTALVSAAR